MIKKQLDLIYSASAYFISLKHLPKSISVFLISLEVPRYSDKYDRPCTSALQIYDIHIAGKFW